MRGFALVELAGDLASIVRIRQIPGSIDGAAQSAMLFERRGEGVLPPGGRQLADQQPRISSTT
jgi:hypothetical protein